MEAQFRLWYEIKGRALCLNCALTVWIETRNKIEECGSDYSYGGTDCRHIPLFCEECDKELLSVCL